MIVGLVQPLKIYPLIILLPWLPISRKMAGHYQCGPLGIVIFLAQLFIHNGWNHWIGFFNYIQNVEQGEALRNNSLHSLAWNLSNLLLPRSNAQIVSTSTTLLVIGITALLVAWIVKRTLQRMRAPELTPRDQFLGNFMDTIISDVPEFPHQLWVINFLGSRNPAGSLGCHCRHRSVGRSGWFRLGSCNSLGAHL